jgi:hypothetical protein
MLPKHFNWIAQQRPHNFGSALERAFAARDTEAKYGQAIG